MHTRQLNRAAFKTIGKINNNSLFIFAAMAYWTTELFIREMWKSLVDVATVVGAPASLLVLLIVEILAVFFMPPYTIFKHLSAVSGIKFETYNDPNDRFLNEVCALRTRIEED